MHDAAFDAAGIDARYVLLELEPDAVEAAVARGARRPDWLGLGVTAPYKRVVAGLVDEVEADAAAIGAVNNVVADRRRAAGRVQHATRPGFRAGVELAMGRPLAGADVVVAGAGGAAHAVVFACLARRRAPGDDRQPDRPIARRRSSSGSPASGTGVGRAVALEDPAFADGAAVGGPGGQRDDGRHARPGHDDPGRRCCRRRRPCSTSSTCRPRRRCSRRRARAACGRRTARRCSSPRRRSRSSAGPGVGGMADVMRAAVAPLLADPTARA